MATMKSLTFKQVKGNIDEDIARILGNANKDPEAAASTRQALYEWALRTIANQRLSPRTAKSIAKAVIVAADIKFKW